MNSEQLTSIFDRQAPTYDQQWAKLAAFRDGLHLLLGSIFHGLPSTARVLCVGAGTGAEIVHLAAHFPGWTFTAVDPSVGMLNACRQRIADQGHAGRCTFHEGFLDSLPEVEPFDAATCLLVSQFILDPRARSDFFRSIAGRLRPGGILASSDLAADTRSAAYQSLLEVWLRTMAVADVPPDGLQRMREAYARDVAILPALEIEAVIASGGFERPVQFFQAGLIHAWYAIRERQCA